MQVFKWLETISSNIFGKHMRKEQMCENAIPRHWHGLMDHNTAETAHLSYLDLQHRVLRERHHLSTSSLSTVNRVFTWFFSTVISPRKNLFSLLVYLLIDI